MLPHVGWPHLEYLSLKAASLSTASREYLLQAVAAAAERMPKLKTLQLCGHSPLDWFVYFVQEERQNSILVPRGLARHLSEATIKGWWRVAAIRNSPCELIIDEMPEDFDSNKDVRS